MTNETKQRINILKNIKEESLRLKGAEDVTLNHISFLVDEIISMLREKDDTLKAYTHMLLGLLFQAGIKTCYDTLYDSLIHSDD